MLKYNKDYSESQGREMIWIKDKSTGAADATNSGYSERKALLSGQEDKGLFGVVEVGHEPH